MVPDSGLGSVPNAGSYGSVSKLEYRASLDEVRPRKLTSVTTALRHRLLIAAPFVALALLAVFTPSDEGPTVCPFALTTGTACPGCGMTRAASYLVKGDFVAAFAYHPLVPLIVFQLAAGWVWYLLRRAGKVKAMSQKTLNVVLIGTAVLFLAVWVVRFASGSLPPV